MDLAVMFGFAGLLGFAVWALAGMLLRTGRHRGTPAV
jgi:hypothetical protein